LVLIDTGGHSGIRKNTMADVEKTLSVPDAGWAYFRLSRNGSYAAAKRGDIPTIKIGKLLRVPVRALEQKLDMASKNPEQP
jgi:hypothetical protein